LGILASSKFWEGYAQNLLERVLGELEKLNIKLEPKKPVSPFPKVIRKSLVG